MGGQTSRMVREIVEDSMYIIRQTNRQKYEQSVAVHREVRSKIEELKRINEKMIHSAKQDAQRAELFETFQSVDAQKKSLDNVVSVQMAVLLFACAPYIHTYR
ncbi:TPA: hypothetical protein N0F65_006526 [Lagenidium giganteum]|uniref:Uncharacterized protein n=1 Tax=Lagenidium giganteum TaxID=4803 RepID=A0AAV2YF93_9STRA|nr:TPA: hypothetical protein N0F65_006526 [Lagenidium giganteum]